MSAGRSFLAAGIVGVVVWAFKREAERHQGQGGTVAPLKSSITPASLPEPQVDRAQLVNAAFDLFSGFLGGGSGNAGQAGSLTLPQRRTAAPRRTAGGVDSLLALIRSKEAPRGYNDYYRGSKIKPPRPLTTMTIREVLAWQDKSVAAGSASSAAGGYQIIRKTLRGLVSSGSVRMDETFSPAVQDRLALALLNQRGLSRYQAGNMTPEAFANSVAKEWASFPMVTGRKKGRSYYAGDGLNAALIDVGSVMDAVRAI